MSNSASNVDRLERALRVWVEWTAAGAREPDALLAAHPDLRELLESMLADREQDAAAAAERRFGDFRLLREIGRGGMGSVWEAVQVSLDRRVAVKLLVGASTASPTSLARFRREATTIARLHHPAIVQVHASGVDDGTPWLAMELIDGAPLAAVDPKTRSRRSPRDCATLVRDVAEALGHAHRSGVVHRDVKPSNVLVRRDGAPVLTDFGLARDDSAPSLTLAGGAGGTPQYMAPEQIRGEAPAPSADVFSLGVTLYELLTGVRPFDAPSAEATIDRVLRDEPLDPRRIEATIDADLAAIVLRAIEKDPQRRYQDGDAMANDLGAWLAGRPVVARVPGAWRKLRANARRHPVAATTLLALALGVPIVAILIGYQIATAPLVAAGERSLRAAREEELWSAFVDSIQPDGGGAMLAAATGLERLGVDPVIVLAARAMSLCEQKAADRALAELDLGITRYGSRVPLLRVRASAQRQLGLASDDAMPAEPDGHLDAFIAGLDEYRRASAFDDLTAHRRAAALFLGAITSSPIARAAYHQAWARAAARAEDRAAARLAVASLEDLFPDAPGSRFAIAFALHDVDPERALELYTSVDDDDRTKAICLRNAGVIHEAQGRLDEAEAAYRASLDRSPRYALAWNSLGKLLLDRSRLADAEAAFRKALAAAPDYVPARNNLGIVLRRTDRAAEATLELRAVTTARPDYARGHYNLGNALMSQRDFAGAESAFRAALRADPGYQRAANNLGNALKSLDRFGEAIDAYALAARLAPKDVVPRHNLGVARRLAGDLEGAERELIEAARLDPNVEPVWVELAEVQELRGETTSAAASRQRAEEIRLRPKQSTATPRFEETGK